MGRWVTRTVCKLVSTGVEFIKDVPGGLWDIFAGILTLDWRRILDGLIRIGLGTLVGAIRLGRIILLGDTLDFIKGEYEKGILKRYIRGLLKGTKYPSDTQDQTKEGIRLDRGAFGLRLEATALRTFLDSETPSQAQRGLSNLVVLHNDKAIDLREFCGFEFGSGWKAFWNRKRYKTIKKGPLVRGGGIGEIGNPISKAVLKDYINSGGSAGPAFFVLPMGDSVLETKLRTAKDKSRGLALMIRWNKHTVAVTQAGHIKHNGYDNPIDPHGSLTSFLVDVIGRTNKLVNDSATTAELCHPVAIGIFQYTDDLRGLANTLCDSGCGLAPENVSGVAFIDNQPDQMWKYVPIHELGHYFGLCHVDGLDRIMFSPKYNTWWRGWLNPRFLGMAYLKGESSFTLHEAMAAWDYIVTNFAPECLGARPIVNLQDLLKDDNFVLPHVESSGESAMR